MDLYLPSALDRRLGAWPQLNRSHVFQQSVRGWLDALDAGAAIICPDCGVPRMVDTEDRPVSCERCGTDLRRLDPHRVPA